MALTYLDKKEADRRLVRLLEHVDFDPFGNLVLEIHGSKLVFTTQGDIQLHPARDLDVKTGRWYHVNSDTAEIAAHLGQVLYGPRGEVLRTW